MGSQSPCAREEQKLLIFIDSHSHSSSHTISVCAFVILLVALQDILLQVIHLKIYTYILTYFIYYKYMKSIYVMSQSTELERGEVPYPGLYNALSDDGNFCVTLQSLLPAPSAWFLGLIVFLLVHSLEISKYRNCAQNVGLISLLVPFCRIIVWLPQL